MHTNFWWKSIIIGTIIFLISSSSIATAFKTTKTSENTLMGGNTFYVGGTGPDNYTVIQYAIDNASDGDTIFVYNGIYSDYFPGNLACVNVNKRIHLQGEDRNHTIINGSKSQRIIFIRSSGIIIDGFTLRYGGDIDPNGAFGCGVYLSQQLHEITIYNTIITENYYGIMVSSECTNIFIHDNIITKNLYGFDNAPDDHNIQIFNNTIAHNKEGLYVYSDDCHIYQNLILNNTIGIQLYGGRSNVIITQNQFQDNSIGIQPLITRATVTQNNFINNTNHVDLYKATTILILPLAVLYRLRWWNNYWDDWNTTSPRPIKGNFGLFIIIPIPKPNAIQILTIPYLEFDWHPAPQPHNLPIDPT